jgi:uncharacterized protein YegP (UPF0339 family)
MAKTTNKPGIHLLEAKGVVIHHRPKTYAKEFYWHIVSNNGRIIARSSETYTRKSGAVKSIRIVSKIFCTNPAWNSYYDYSKKDSPLISYL